MRRRGTLVFLLLVLLLVVLWFLDPLQWLGGRSKDRETGEDAGRGEAPPDKAPRAEPGFVVGTVTAGEGAPLSGAVITGQMGSGFVLGPTTGVDGRYRVSSRFPPPPIKVQFRGMNLPGDATPDAATIERVGAIVNFVGPRDVVLRGFVAVRDGDALPGATISVGSHSTTSGDRGTFSLTIPFDILRPDPAPSLRVEADGHEPHEEPFPFTSYDDLGIFLEPK